MFSKLQKHKLKITHSGITQLFIAISVALLFASCGGNKVQKALDSKKEGIDLIQKSQFDLAIEKLNHSLSYNDQDPETIYYIGNAFFGKKDYDKAMEYYDLAISVDSTFAQAYVNRGRIYFMRHDRCKSCENWLKAEALGVKNLKEDTKFCK